jgi:hypothetical protein
MKTHLEKKKHGTGWVQWLMPIIPATQEAETRKIAVGAQPRQKVIKTSI